ncbi:MAG: winged helix-turn-helix domain-containing protein [Chloroflexi bacterium]|nr:winged helix-turn-helix domain-containing protein [Chloroflexota bacterium]
MQSGPAPLLVVRRQDAAAIQIEWTQPSLTIGRDTSNDIVIDHPLASRRHARLERDDGGYSVRDLDSTNGTYVNGERIEGVHALHNQDRIWVADAEIVFNDPEATQKGPLPLEILKRVRGTEELLRLDSRAKEVYVQGKLLEPPLTVKEFQLLELLYTHKGQVISKDEIARNVWDYEVYDYNAIDALVYRLRQRIEADPGNPRYLVTVRGFGYKLVTQGET